MSETQQPEVKAQEIDAREELRQRILALKKERGQDKVASPITSGELATARSVLAEIGVGVIFVVPETWDLSGGNPAICLTDGSQVTTYSKLLNLDRGKYDEEAATALPKEFTMHDILVKQSVVGMADIKRCGIIWHEFGHTHLGADENGEVFTNELQSLRKKFTKEDVASYVTDFRKVGYFAANAVDPGRDKLIAALGELDIDLLGAMKKLEDDAREAMQKKLVLGFTLTGQPAKFKGRAGALEDLPDGVDRMEEGAQFSWSGVTWKVRPRVYDYVLEVVQGANSSLWTGRKIQGTPLQLKGRADARDVPEGLDARQPGEQFGWDGSTWKLVSKETVHSIEVV